MPRRIWLAPLCWGVAYLVLTTVTRVTLAAWVWRDLPHDAVTLALVALRGFLSDLLMAAVFILPWAGGLVMTTDRWRARPWVMRGTAAVAFLSFFLFTFLAIVEVAFFDEFSARFNYMAVDYLLFPTEVAGNIWQSYPVLRVLLGTAAVSVGLFAGLGRPLLQSWSSPAGLADRVRMVVGLTVLIAALACTAPPVGARLGDNALAGEISGNGHRSFFNALWTSDLDYTQYYRTMPLADAVPRVRRLLWDPETREESSTSNPFRRRLSEDGRIHRPNIVLVIEESFGAAFTGVLRGNSEHLTPAFDRLANEGVLFTNFYATGSRTVRGLEAILCGFPPIPGVSILKRRPFDGIFSWPAVMKSQGYDTMFLYGGRGIFDNMRPFLTANGFDRFIEQSDFDHPAFTTAWGVSDEDIFDRALREFDERNATGRPFFGAVLTVSNHKPYTYPSGRIDLPPERRRREHAVKYADWALGRFFDRARRRPFFNNTIFVILGDHGARVYGADFIPIRSYEVPFLIYAPRWLSSRCVDVLGSSLDVASTVMGLTDIHYDSVFFGRDLFDLTPERGYALMQHDRDVGILRGNRLAVFGPDRSARLFDYHRETSRFSDHPVLDASCRELLDDGVAIYQTAYQLHRQHRYQLAGK
jgi:hypothetical protein